MIKQGVVSALIMVALVVSAPVVAAEKKGTAKATAVYKGNPVLKSGKWSFCPGKNGKAGKCITVSGGSTKSRKLQPGDWLVKYCSNDGKLSGDRVFVIRAGIINAGRVKVNK